MTVVEPETETLTQFAADPGRYVDKLRSSDLPLILTDEGKEELVLINASAFRQYQEAKSHFDEIAAIKEGLDDFAAGRYRPMREFMNEVAARFQLTSTNG